MDASDGVVARHAAGSADYRGRVPGGCERRSPPRIAVRPRKPTEVRLLAVEESCATVTRPPSFFLLRRGKKPATRSVSVNSMPRPGYCFATAARISAAVFDFCTFASHSASYCCMYGIDC